MKYKTIPDKIGRRIVKILSKYLWYNKKYRPLGVRNLLPNDDAAIQYVELNPPYVSTLDLSPEFIRDCVHYYKPVVSIQIPGDYFLTIKDGRVYSYDSANMAVISGSNYLIEEVSFQWSDSKMLGGNDNQIFKQKIFTTPRKYKGRVFSMLGGGGAVTYYYHWVFDSIAKLALLKASGQFDSIDFFLVPNYEHKYQKEYLDFFGISNEKFINGNLTRHIQADYLMVCSFVRTVEDHLPIWASNFLFNSFNVGGGASKNEKLIYIARGDAGTNRKVKNEGELIDELNRHGFEVYLLSEISVVEQARLFYSAKIIVSVHGAGLSNLVYCRQGTKVLEIFPASYVRHAFYDLSNKRGLDYHYLCCPADGTAENGVEGQKINLTAEIGAIKTKVVSLLTTH